MTGWAAGDPVTVMPLIWDGTCPPASPATSTSARTSTFMGIDSPGALQALWNVPASTLVSAAGRHDLRHAALIEPVAVAVHDVRRGGVAEGDTVVVLGGGPIGTC